MQVSLLQLCRAGELEFVKIFTEDPLENERTAFPSFISFVEKKERRGTTPKHVQDGERNLMLPDRSSRSFGIGFRNFLNARTVPENFLYFVQNEPGARRWTIRFM